ncbi:hypothetical protein QJS10_CPB15g01436 [Acorus calamus]|uniref:Uncharacterized protein n=1 Tax=Acorus calamus TaxID=4465 RepID=A0AAV9D5N2_ACOCL|nr:hypothetical protein QJS10_CPB15g01436 [Acorus calamus]
MSGNARRIKGRKSYARQRLVNEPVSWNDDVKEKSNEVSQMIKKYKFRISFYEPSRRNDFNEASDSDPKDVYDKLDLRELKEKHPNASELGLIYIHRAKDLEKTEKTFNLCNFFLENAYEKIYMFARHRAAKENKSVEQVLSELKASHIEKIMKPVSWNDVGKEKCKEIST